MKADSGVRFLGKVDFEPFLGFDRLMQSVAPGSIGHESARELVYNDHLVVIDDVLLVSDKERCRRQGLVKPILPGAATRPQSPQGFGQLGQALFSGRCQMNSR